MRTVFILLIFLSLYAHQFSTKIISVSNNVITTEANLKKGISGIVLCPYEKQEIICARCVSAGKNKAVLYSYKKLKNTSFALPVVFPKKGDLAVFGKNYQRIAIIAPNQEIYLKLKQKFNHFTIIPVDTFGAFLDDIPTINNFINFAKKMDVGMYVFALDKLYIVDALTFYTYAKEDYEKSGNFKLPFYTSYNFDLTLKNPVKYYKSLIKE